MKTLSYGGWIRGLTDDERDFADWAESRGMESIFEFYPNNELVVCLSLEETIGGMLYARAINTGDLPLGPQISVREYLEQRLRRDLESLKKEHGVLITPETAA